MTTEEKRRGRPAGYSPKTQERMQAIIDFVRTYHKQHSIAPTLKEIALGIGMTAADSGNVTPLINDLVRLGYLTRAGWHQGRSIAIAKKPPKRWFYVPK